MKRIIFFAIIAGFIATSCTIKQEFNFDANYAGSVVYELDYAAAMESMAIMAPDMLDSLSEDSSFAALNEHSDEIMDVTGITNYKFANDMEAFKSTTSYNFKDIEALNLAINTTKMDEGEAFRSFIAKDNNKIVFDFWLNEFDDLNEPAEKSKKEGEESEEDMFSEKELTKMFFGDINYEVVLNFEQPIKKISNDLYTLSEDKKKISLSINMAEVVAQEKDLNLVITL